MRRLVDILDRVDAHADFDPKRDYDLVLKSHELTAEEAVAAGKERSVDDIELDLSTSEAEAEGDA